jgi:hypothetical protein
VLLDSLALGSTDDIAFLVSDKLNLRGAHSRTT